MKEPCCPGKGRRGNHKHLRHVANLAATCPVRIQYDGPTPYIENVIEHLKREDRQIDQIKGGEGSLAMALAKEIYGNEEYLTRYQQYFAFVFLMNLSSTHV